MAESESESWAAKDIVKRRAVDPVGNYLLKRPYNLGDDRPEMTSNDDKRLGADPVGSYLLRRRRPDPVGSYLLKKSAD